MADEERGEEEAIPSPEGAHTHTSPQGWSPPFISTGLAFNTLAANHFQGWWAGRSLSQFGIYLQY